VAFNIVTGDLLWCEFWCQHLGQFSLNVRVYRITNAILSPEIPSTTFVSLLSSRARILFRAVLPSQGSYYGVRIRPFPLNAETPEYKVQVTSGVWAGKGLPGQVAMLIRSTTGLFGRKNKGRNYIPFIPPAALDELNKPTAAYNDSSAALVQFLGVGGTIGTGVNGAALQAVTRRFFDGAPRNFVSATLVQTPATMRTRSKMNRPTDDVPFV